MRTFHHYKEPTWANAIGGIFVGFILVAGLFLFGIALLMFKAYVFVQLWDWFIIPVFTYAPAINYIQAIGISLVLTFYVASKSYQTIKEKNDYLIYLWESCLDILIVWGIGYVVHLFL